MKRLIESILFAFAIALTAPSLAADDIGQLWSGDYEYSDSFWDGTQSVITDIKLKIARDGRCTLSQEGFQLDEHILCSAEEGKLRGRLDILFVSYPDGAVKNEYGVEVYKIRDRLFSLQKSRGNSIVTIWSSSYRPPKAKTIGIFFEKVK